MWLPTLRRVGVGFVWYVVPAFAVVAVAAYVLGAVVWHANPPAVPVSGVSMRPTLAVGDLVLLKGVDPGKLRKGDIVAFHVPKTSRVEFGLPGELIHRIIKIKQSPTGPIFQTKGDGNTGQDAFVIHGGDVVGRMVLRAPGLGYPLLFFRSTQGKIFIGVAVLIAIMYFLIGMFEQRRVYVEGTALGMQAVLSETEELRRLIEGERHAGPGPPGHAPGSLSPLPPAGPSADWLANEVRETSERSKENSETLRELLVAIREYGVHLRSHTAVMQGLAATTGELHDAATALRLSIPENAPLPVSGAVAPARGEQPIGAPPAASVPPLAATPPSVVDTEPLRSREPVATAHTPLAAPAPPVSPPPAVSAAPAVESLPALDRSQWPTILPSLASGYGASFSSTRRVPARRDRTMGIDPTELRQPALERSLRGYAPEAVERLLARAAEALEDGARERDELRSRLEQIEEELVHRRKHEESVSHALIVAERNANELKEQAKREAELLLKEAQLNAREIAHQAIADRERTLADARGVRSLLETALSALNDSRLDQPLPEPAPPVIPDTSA